MGPIQLVVFDLAGTTIEDKGSVVLNALVETAQHYELPGTPQELNALMGMNKREVFEILAAQCFPTDEARINHLAGQALADFIARMRAAYELKLPDWRVQHLWNGYYMVNPLAEVYTETIAGMIRIVTGIAGKGMSTGPGFARHSIEHIVR